MMMTAPQQVEAEVHLLAVLNELDIQSPDPHLYPAYRAAKDFLERHPTPYSQAQEAGVIRLIDDVCEAIWHAGNVDGINHTITQCEPFMAARKFCQGKRQIVSCGECDFTYRGEDAEQMQEAHHAMTGH